MNELKLQLQVLLIVKFLIKIELTITASPNALAQIVRHNYLGLIFLSRVTPFNLPKRRNIRKNNRDIRRKQKKNLKRLKRSKRTLKHPSAKCSNE